MPPDNALLIAGAESVGLLGAANYDRVLERYGGHVYGAAALTTAVLEWPEWATLVGSLRCAQQLWRWVDSCTLCYYNLDISLFEYAQGTTNYLKHSWCENYPVFSE